MTPLCPTCGEPIEDDGLCPACLMAGGFRTGSSTSLTGAETITTTSNTEAALEYDDFGVYTISRVLGEGGMGTVYLAAQSHPIERTVALKVIKPGMDSGQILARFNYER
ncbi:MAG: hypothetical protein K7J46_05360 [Bryobacter sp.]|jgi:serine/threonine protein kinase|nr:hypothetical protein [Bryobacter sp. CoA8 C33]